MEGRKGGRVARRGELEEDSLRGGGDKEAKGEMWEIERQGQRGL